MAGWIKLHRSLIDWEWYNDANTCRLFIHLLLRANHKPKKWRGKTIEAGQLLTGRKALSAQTGLSEQQIRTSLSKLKSTNEITIKSTSQDSIITLVCWESYQQNNHEDNQRATNEQPTDNQQVTTNKNVKNENNEKNEKKVTKTWEPPEGLNLEAWQEFEQHRKDIKKPMTNLARTKAANQIIGLSSIDQQSTIDKSIASRWPGLYPDKVTAAAGRPTREQQAAQANDDLLAHYEQKNQVIEGECNEQFEPSRLN